MLKGLGEGFEKSKKLLGTVMQSMDGMLSRASGSMCAYIVLFTIIIVALVYKLR